MALLLTKLEPRFEAKKTIIVDEFDEFNEVIFVFKGTVVIGYEINKQKRYALKHKNCCVIGGYGCSFNQRSAFIYTALTNIHAYSVRKENWHHLLTYDKEVTASLKQNVLIDYILKIRSKLVVKKKKAQRDLDHNNTH